MQSTIDAIVSSDTDGKIVYWNRGAEHMFGYREKEVLGNSLTMLMPERFRAAHRRGIEARRLKKTSSLVGRVVELYGLKKDGSEFPMELSLCSWEANEDPYYTGIIRDTSEREKARKQLGKAAEELRIRNTAMEDDLALAREVQESLLPQHYPVFPRTAIPGDSALRFWHLYHPSGQVGGDFFDVVALSETRAAVFICDVMGHGIRAALVTATLRGIIEQILSSAKDPGSFMTELNKQFMRIFKYTEREMFASAFLLWVDATTGETQYANAGHPSPLHLNRQHRIVEPFFFAESTRGPALGFVEDFPYATSQNYLTEHDLVMLFTDGLYEVEGPDRQEYGQGRLVEFLRTKMDLPMEHFLDQLLADIHQFANGNRFEDDLCLVALEVDHLVTERT